MSDLSKQLRSGAAYVRRFGYLHGDQGRDGEPRCALGIIAGLYGLGAAGMYSKSCVPAILALGRVIPKMEDIPLIDDMHQPAWKVATWNNSLSDSPNPTEIVAAAFEQAAALEEAKDRKPPEFFIGAPLEVEQPAYA